MILPIRAFGDAVLRKHCHEIDKDYPELKTLVENMLETMHSANGIGLASPQVGLDIRLFIVDVSPLVREDVKRKETILIEYYDENFVKHTDTFSDMRARVIQHEYDHIEGILFTDHLSSLKKKLVKGKLMKISQGEVSVTYKMRFPK